MEKNDRAAGRTEILPQEDPLLYTEGAGRSGLRVLFVGNSLTRHGPKADIGWEHDWGMAASAKEKDYVHVCARLLRENDPELAVCVCQAAHWELGYRDTAALLPRYAAARAFAADVIVLRLAENCSLEEWDAAAFRAGLEQLLRYLDADGHAAVVIGSSFTGHPADEVLCEAAAALGAPYVVLNDLGSQPAMRADGLFAHEGVAHHPGDAGMAVIAERFAAAVRALP